MLAALLAYAAAYGMPAVMWVNANAWWLIPLGPFAFQWIRNFFG